MTPDSLSRKIKRLICFIDGHDLTGPEDQGRLLCTRCGDVFDAVLLRAFDAELRERGDDGLLPSESEPTSGAQDAS